MSEPPSQRPRLLTLDPQRPPAPPGWAIALAPVALSPLQDDGLTVQMSSGPAAQLITLTARGARAADAAALEALAATIYRRIASVLAEAGHVAPARFWNHIPGIGEDMGRGLDRYRVFNKGRKAALAEWMGERDFDRRLPAATGVGHEGDDLVVHCLACTSEGHPLENPRQRPAYRYSARYGPASPSFARATRVALGRRSARHALLVGGTASVRGEDTVHEGDLEAQFAETVENLRALLAAAGPCCSSTRADDADPDAVRRFTSVRVYFREAAHEVRARSLSLATFAGAEVVELMRADICRPELLVEIEGLAELAPAPVAGASSAAAGAARGD